MDHVFLTRLRPIFQRVFSLLPATFPLLIFVLFLPFPLYLSSFFLFWEFCGLKVPKTTDLRTIRKIQFFDLGYRRRRLRKSTKHTLSYYAFVRDPSRGGNSSFGVGFGWFEGSSEKLDTRRHLYEISLSLVFSFFSPFIGILIGAGSVGLKDGRGVAVISRGICKTRRSPENSATKFFFSVFFFFPFFSFFSFPSRYLLEGTTSLVSLKAGRSEFGPLSPMQM